MPRKKTIDCDEIRIEKIDKTTVEIKNCLGASLIFQKPFTAKQWHTLNSYFKCETVESENKVIIKTGNSWKGLVMFLLSVAYCRFDMKFPARICDVHQYTTTEVSFEYKHLLRGQSGDLSELTNDKIEQIVSPKSWKPCYVRGGYTVKDIQKSISNLSQILGIDMKNSTIQTEFTSQFPHGYKSKPAQRVDTSHLLCSALKTYADGICFVTADTMKNLINRAVIVPDEIPPNKIEICLQALPHADTIDFFAYEVTTQTIESLCTYFPFFTLDFQQKAKQTDVLTLVIFDRTYLGKWG